MLQLPYLQKLDLSSNDGLVGHLPKSNWSCSRYFDSLDLSEVRFSSKLPDSCSPGCLQSLDYLNLSGGKILGTIPPWLGNLSQITGLVLSSNSFSGQVPATLSTLQKLDQLDLNDNNLEGEIPNGFAQLTKLWAIHFGGNDFHGKFPHWLTNLTELEYLFLESNKFTGTIPSNTSELQKLTSLSLSDNSIGGTISTTLFELPVSYLDLSSNQLSGTIPSNLTGYQNSAVHTLDLSNNYLSCTLEPLSFVNLTELEILHLSHNSFQGPLPLVPHSISHLLISNNKFHGDIPPSICGTMGPVIIDLSRNYLTGMIPKCFSHFTDTLLVLNLGMNSLGGTIPLNFPKGNWLRSINLNGNHLEGQVPRSLTHCNHLEVLDLGNNNLNDVFPYWLDSLAELQVLVLRTTSFMVRWVFLESRRSIPFQNSESLICHTINSLVHCPTNYFLSFDAMRNDNHTQTTLEYMGEDYYNDTVVITLKGVEFEIKRILKVLATVDFSSNRFEGQIPNDIGSLLGIQSLNLSSNILTGRVPSSLANLRVLESLDLSSNQLSGVIPQELTHITTLEVLNLSNNHLTGPIPRGFQFDTFQNNSYIGNLELCGLPLSTKCSDNGSPHDQPSHEKDHEEGIFDGFGWKTVLLGYGCGTVFGLGVGFVMFSTGKPKRLVRFVE